MRDYASCSWFHAGAQAALIGMNSWRFLPRSHTAFSHGLSQIKSLPWVGSCKPKSWTGLYPPATLQDCTRGKNEAWKGKTSSEEHLENEKLLYIYSLEKFVGILLLGKLFWNIHGEKKLRSHKWRSQDCSDTIRALDSQKGPWRKRLLSKGLMTEFILFST